MSEITKKTRTEMGRVVSNKGDKTITVLIEKKKPHPRYNKYVKSSSKISAHDENNVCEIGDTVKIEECRPYSKNKSWKLNEILVQANRSTNEVKNNPSAA
ncbi:MAG: 30S ribosomal protein S17 [Gammaproteobacteria bacterium]|nr:30S ribosomal protein S17 [Gammaproteobacteria bacterium]